MEAQIKTLYTDKEKSTILLPKTSTKAVSNDEGVGLEALLKNLPYYASGQGEEDDPEVVLSNADSLGGIPADEYASKTFVKEEVLKIQTGGDVDLSEYATKDEVANIDFPVDSINGKTGAVQLSASDVGAYSNKGRLDGNIDTLSLDGTYWIETSKCTGTFPKEWGNYGFLHAFADYQKLVQYTDNGAGSSWERYYVNDKWYSWVLTCGAGKQDTITGAVSTLTSDNLNASIVPISNVSGKIVSSNITATELSYLDGVTSNIQTQLDTRYKVRSTINNKPESDIKDLNEVKNIGYYWVQCAGVTNTPFGDNNSGKYGHLEYCGNGLQRFTQYGSTGIVAVYERDNVQTGWKAWKRVDSLNKIDKFTIPYGTPVDTGITYYGQAVKCMAVELGSPINGVKSIDTGVQGIIGIWANGNNNQLLPYDDGSTWIKIKYVSSGTIGLESNSNVSHWNCYAIIFYIW